MRKKAWSPIKRLPSSARVVPISNVLDAQTSVTQSRITQIQSARDYLVAVARLERATGQNVAQAR